MQPLEPTDPRAVGRYRILARIGAGGMAIVYFGRSVGGRAVAVKTLHTEFASDPAYRARFASEVVASRAAGGRYSPAVLDADSDAPVPWLAMDFLPAVSLHEVSPLPGAAILPLAAGLVEALASIHAAGLVHLDLTPRNVLLTSGGPRLIDFGVAAQAWSGVPLSQAGSRGFIAPEPDIGPASDVYALGATLAYACPSADGLIRALIDDCLHADPAARPTLDDLAARLSSVDAGRWLPDAVLSEIDRRAQEADYPPPPRFTEPRQVSRRVALSLAGGALVAGGAAVWIGTQPETGVARPAPSSPPPAPASTAVTQKPARIMEIMLSGTATPKTVTVLVNGKAEAPVTALPWRKKYEIPDWPVRTRWRIEYHLSAGTFRHRVLVDGSEYSSGGGSSSLYDISPERGHKPHEGII